MVIRLTAAEKAAWKRKGLVGDRQRPHKYGAVKTVVDGITFASKAEAKRYGELKLLEKAGEVYGLLLQPRYALSVENAGYPDDGHGRTITLGAYVADFAYMRKRRDGTDFVIEDVKGMKTPMYRWKKKHFEAQYGVEITEIGCAPRSAKAKRAPDSRAKRQKPTHKFATEPLP